MTTKKAIERLDWDIISYLMEKSVISFKLYKRDLPLLNKALNALKVRKRLEEAIANAEKNGKIAISIPLAKFILEGEKE